MAKLKSSISHMMYKNTNTAHTQVYTTTHSSDLMTENAVPWFMYVPSKHLANFLQHYHSLRIP